MSARLGLFTKNTRDFFEIVSFCVALSWRSSRFYTLARLFCSIVTPILGLAVTFLSKDLLDLLAGETGGADRERTLLFIFTCFLIIAVVRLAAGKLLEYCQTMHGEMVQAKAAVTLMEKGISADLEFFDNPEFYNKLSAANMDAPQINMVLFNVVSAVSALITFTVSFSVLCGYNVLYGLLTLVAGIPAGISAVAYTKRLYFLTMSQLDGERQKGYVSGLVMSKHYAQSIKFFNAGEMLKKRYTSIWTSLFAERKKSIKARSFVTCALSCLPEIVIVYVGIDVSFKVLRGQALIGDYSLYSGLVSQLWTGIYLLSSALVQIYDNRLKIGNFKALDAIKNRVVDSGTKKLERIDSVSFENVTFTYPGNTKPTLRNVTFSVKKAEKIVLVGLNGSGKSTLIKLLLRFYDIDGGSIKINGADIKEYRVDDIRRNFSVYFQEEENFCFTLRDNITISDEGVGGDEVVNKALNGSGASDILKKASMGLDTYVRRLFSADGLELSGGQRQKIALSRTFFRRHTALILDEPSSSLDPKSEHELFERLKAFAEGKITIFTSHRLSNVSLADRIVVLEAGEVLEIGTQSELMKKEGRYAELFKYQQEKYGAGQ